MATFSTDCLLLCIEEMYGNLERNDTTMFIYYDTRMREFHLLGKRNNTNVITFVPYSFTCKSKSKLYSFIKFVICNSAKCKISLYNYDNFPENCEDISYDFIEKHRDNEYLITSYHVKSLGENSLQLDKVLEMLEYVNNEY
jgi:hypothetical protein